MAEGVDPYKISTIVLACIVAAVAIAALMKDRMGAVPTMQTTGVKEFSYVMVLFLPHILMVFGFIADALAQDVRYSIPSIAGFLSIFLNYGAGILFKKVSDMMSSAPPSAPLTGASLPSPMSGGGIELAGCYIPGFETFISEYSSAPLVVTFTIMFYYLMDLLQNRGFQTSISTIVAMVSFVAAQFFVLRANGCFARFSSVGVPLATSSLLGLLFGGMTYLTIQSTSPSSLPSAVYSVQSQTPAPTKQKTGGGCSGGQCGPPADDDQFVCDTYLNGVKTTE